MAFIKLSILMLYGEIFISRRFHICLWLIASFMLLWAVSLSFAAIFQCTPIAYNWDTSIQGGSCINYGAVVIAGGALNIVTDFVILTAPIPLVMRLHTNSQKKWQILLTFAMGSRYVQLLTLLAFSNRLHYILTDWNSKCLYREHCATSLCGKGWHHCRW